MSEWKPIETAPKDRAILGCWPRKDGKNGWHVDRIWWDHQFEADGWDDEADDTNWRAAWSAGRVASWNYQEFHEEHPVYWMDIPNCDGLTTTDVERTK